MLSLALLIRQLGRQRAASYAEWRPDGTLVKRPVDQLCGKCRRASLRSKHRARKFKRVSGPAAPLGHPTPTASAAHSAAHPLEKRAHSPGLIRVLCVDDDPLVRKYLVAHLEMAGDIQVVGAAASVEEACGFLYEHRVDVVLLDYCLQGRDGVQLLRIIVDFFDRERPAGKRPSVLFCTGQASEPFLCEVRGLGSAGVLPKQRAARELLPAVRAVAQGEMWFGTG